MNQSIVDKIRKLLALATSSNEHEARLAAEKANELLIRHNLKMQDLGEEGDYAKDPVLVAGRLKPQTDWIVSILQQHFFVVAASSRQYYRHQTILYLVGKKTNLEIAHYVYVFLDRTFPGLWQQWKAEQGRRAGLRKNYYHGLHNGLNYQLDQRRAQLPRSKASRRRWNSV